MRSKTRSRSGWSWRVRRVGRFIAGANVDLSMNKALVRTTGSRRAGSCVGGNCDGVPSAGGSAGRRRNRRRRSTGRTVNPARRAALAPEHDEIWQVRETAERLAAAERERAAIAEGVRAWHLQKMRERRGLDGPFVPRMAIKVRLERERAEYGLQAVEALGLGKWLRPR
jgi:hypothetical protein